MNTPAESTGKPQAEKTESLMLKVGGMSCSFCSESIRKAYRRTHGVVDASVSLAHEEALIQYDPDRVTPQELSDTLRSLGYTVRDPEKVRSFEDEEQELQRELYRLAVAAAFSAAALAFMVAMWLGYMEPWFQWVMMVLALATMFGPGWYIVKMAVASLRRGILNQHVLLEISDVAAMTGGFIGLFSPLFPAVEFFGVSVFVTTYHILSGYVSLLVRTRASQSVRKLMDLQPPTARVIKDGREVEVPIAEVSVGDRVRIRPGEQVPVDGQVVEGASGVDESLVTGESIPTEKRPGDEVIGGSLNQTGTLVVQVTRVGAESFIQQIARHVQEARALKPGIIQLVDRVLTVFVPGVVVVAVSALIAWMVLGWLFEGTPLLVRGIFAMLAALVMGYPCALGMATPLALIRGGGIAAEHGILLRSGEAFQVFKDIRYIVLDKTGTITEGKPQVTDLIPLGGVIRRELLRLVAGAESPSEHPLAQAILNRADEEQIELPDVDDFRAEPGRGITARIEGREVLVGSPRYLTSAGVALGPVTKQLEALEAQGKTVIAAAAEGQVLGLIAIADAVKRDAAEAVRRLRELGLEPVMLTGDNERTARAVAAEVGISKVRAQVLPDEKAAVIRDLQRQGHRVAMVGDGINDAPALTQADVGLAIGAGTDIAIESADIILIGERLTALVDAYHIARSSYRKTVQNLTLAFMFNGIGVPAGATGLVHPVWAMAAMLASVTTVLLNSFGGRLLPRRSLVHQAPRPEREVYLLSIPTIHCEGCYRTIKATLERCDGVLDISGEVAKQRVTVSVDRQRIKEAELRTELERIGHVVTEVGTIKQEAQRVV
jgi:heavy metal translocating P-type ATPase